MLSTIYWKVRSFYFWVQTPWNRLRIWRLQRTIDRGFQ